MTRERRERQEKRLSALRNVVVVKRRAYRVWCAYFDMPLMGGWQVMMEDFRGRDSFNHHWIDRDFHTFKPELMRLFPLVAEAGSEACQWQQWKPAFAARFERRRQDGEPLGVAYIWWDSHSRNAPTRAL